MHIFTGNKLLPLVMPILLKSCIAMPIENQEDTLGMKILTGNRDVTYHECTVMRDFTANQDLTHRQFTSSPGSECGCYPLVMAILTKDVHNFQGDSKTISCLDPSMYHKIAGFDLPANF